MVPGAEHAGVNSSVDNSSAVNVGASRSLWLGNVCGLGNVCRTTIPFCLTLPPQNELIMQKMQRAMDSSDFRLDPSVCPVRIELDLDPQVFDHLQRLSARSGRSIDELVVEFIDRAMGVAPLPDEFPSS